MSLGFNTKQAQYLYVKQKLDCYNLPTIFPFQCVSLLSKLIQKLDQQTKISHDSISNQIKNSSSSQQPNSIQVNYNFVDKALRSQLSKILNENNQLHIDIITLKQQNQAGKHCLDKLLVQKSDNKQQIRNIIQFKNERQLQLKEQLEVAKFKYNQLVDFIHEEDNLERMYIKRLFNHKKYDVRHQNGERVGNSGKKNREAREQNQDHEVTVLKDRRQQKPSLNKSTSSKPKDSRKRINKTLEYDHHQQKQNPSAVNKSINLLQQKLAHIQQKLFNREKQIQRLQAKITYEGLNLNNVLVAYTDQLNRKKLIQMQQRLQFMQTQYLKMKTQLQGSRKKGGRYQALRQQVQKCHAQIKELKKQNREIKRNKKQNDFDLEKERKQMSRSINHYNHQKVGMKVTKYADDLVIEDLRRKVQFYEREVGKMKDANGNNKVNSKKITAKQGKVAQNNKKEEKKSTKSNKTSSKKIKSIIKVPKQQQNHQNSSQLRQRYEDQIKIDSSSNPRPETSSGSRRRKPQAQNPSTYSHPIRQIPQQQESSSSQSQLQLTQQDKQKLNQINLIVQKQNGQRQQIKELNLKRQSRQNKKERSDKKQNQEDLEQDDSSQQQQEGNGDGEDSELDEKKQTLIQQYQETINQLTNKYLSVKEELEVRNQEIMTLERVVDKLMKEKQAKYDVNEPKNNQQNSKNENQLSQKISKLTKQVESLSAMLNQSQFQKQELRREVIQMQQLYKRINFNNQKQISSEQQLNKQNGKNIQELTKIIQQKDVRLEQYRILNAQLEQRLEKSIQRIKRLNDQVDYLSQQKEELIKQLEVYKSKLDSVAYVAHQEHRRHSQTIELAQVQKNEIIALRKQLLAAQIKIGQLQNEILRKQVSKLRN